MNRNEITKSSKSRRKNILVLAAHPDDEVLGCGGTIARFAQAGDHISLMTFSDGTASRSSGSRGRQNSLIEAARILGVQSVLSGSFPDNAMDSVPLLEVCRYIEKGLDHPPDIIFTHHPNCLNIDHSIVFRATVTVFRPQVGVTQKILSYYVPSSTDYNPRSEFRGNCYMDVSAQVETKLKALSCYDEEMRPFPHARSRENIINLMRVWGAEVGIQSAEKFELIREVIMA